MGTVIAKQRLFLTADKSKLVAEADPDGAFLYAAPGDEIPDDAHDRFGLEDGALPGFELPGTGDDDGKVPNYAPAPRGKGRAKAKAEKVPVVTKEAGPGQNKDAGAGEDKGAGMGAGEGVGGIGGGIGTGGPESEGA